MDVFCSSELGTIEESSTHVASAVKRTKAVSSNVSRVETKVTYPSCFLALQMCAVNVKIWYNCHTHPHTVSQILLNAKPDKEIACCSTS